MQTMHLYKYFFEKFFTKVFFRITLVSTYEVSQFHSMLNKNTSLILEKKKCQTLNKK